MFPPIIRYFLRQKHSPFYNLAELAVYLWKRNSWFFDFSRFFRSFKKIKIDRPVFLLGVEGAGLTLVSRMIRKDRNFVSVSGNFRYWAGADEMQLVLGPVLPAQFTGIKHKRPCCLRKKGLTANSIYATEGLLDSYRLTKKDVTPELRKKFRKIIRWRIAKTTVDKQGVRFIDKSQVFTVKLSFINEILKDTNPKFILITRNPYALCYRVANANAGNYAEKTGGSFKEALGFACEHWVNSMKIALEDSRETKNFLVLKIEDLIQEPEKKLREICEFIEIGFNEDLLPKPEHKIPFGSKGKNKWYPIRRDINKKYLEKISKEEADIIEKYVSEYAEKFGYLKPNL